MSTPETDPRDEQPITQEEHEAGVEREAILAVIKEATAAHPLPYMKDGWEPHPWVMEAMGVLYRKSEQARREANDEKDFVLEQMAEQHEKDQQGMVKATVAAVLEAIGDGFYLQSGNKKTMMVNINMDLQRTIWDRATCRPQLSEDQKTVVWEFVKK